MLTPAMALQMWLHNTRKSTVTVETACINYFALGPVGNKPILNWPCSQRTHGSLLDYTERLNRSQQLESLFSWRINKLNWQRR